MTNTMNRVRLLKVSIELIKTLFTSGEVWGLYCVEGLPRDSTVMRSWVDESEQTFNVVIHSEEFDAFRTQTAMVEILPSVC